NRKRGFPVILAAAANQNSLRKLKRLLRDLVNVCPEPLRNRLVHFHDEQTRVERKKRQLRDPAGLARGAERGTQRTELPGLLQVDADVIDMDNRVNFFSVANQHRARLAVADAKVERPVPGEARAEVIVLKIAENHVRGLRLTATHLLDQLARALRQQSNPFREFAR